MAYLSLFFHATIALLLWPATLARNHTDHLSLLAIKSSITQDPQGVLDTWNTSLHFCQWQGVTCGRRHPRVTMLDLGSRAFVGSLSPHIGNLTFLRVIRLQNNSFNGVIPPQVGGLFRLQELVLSNNTFEGEVPASLSNCTRLHIIGLGGNELVGKLPQQLGLLLPLHKPCEHLSASQLEVDEDEESGFTWKVVMSGYGCRTILGMVIGYLMLSKTEVVQCNC